MTMSEFGDGSIERHHFNPESNLYIMPLDPYDERLIQFTALKQMGYPVDIQQISVEGLSEDIFVYKEMEWERDNYPTWVRPIVNLAAFETYIDNLDYPGDGYADDEVLSELLENHPVKLVHKIDFAYVHMLAYELETYEKNDLQFLSDPGTGILTKDFFVGCFMAALERYVDRRARGYEYWFDETWQAVTVDDFIRHNTYKLQGFRPVSPEQLGAIVMNYYELVERIQPDILQFKSTPITG